MKRRRFTAAERAEARDLARRGRSGTLGIEWLSRCTELYELSPEEYSEIGKLGRADADAQVNPLARDPEAT